MSTKPCPIHGLALAFVIIALANVINSCLSITFCFSVTLQQIWVIFFITSSLGQSSYFHSFLFTLRPKNSLIFSMLTLVLVTNNTSLHVFCRLQFATNHSTSNWSHSPILVQTHATNKNPNETLLDLQVSKIQH